MRTWIAILSAPAVLAVSMSCGPNAGTDNDGNGDGNGDGTGGVDAGDDPGGDDPTPGGTAAVYAHSASQLYRVDPETLDVTLVGNFSWPFLFDEMTDIAIDKDGRMTGISYDSVYSVDKDTAVCTYLSALSARFNGLSWVPGNSPDPNGPERLVGAALNGDVVEIDPDTGATTVIGNYQGGWFSSGDIVAVRDFGILATVTNDSANDFLARIDPTTWRATIIGDTGYDVIWGLGFWKNQVYGFTDDQRFVLIDPTTGAASPVENSTVNWWGAGVTTRAPVIE